MEPARNSSCMAWKAAPLGPWSSRQVGSIRVRLFPRLPTILGPAFKIWIRGWITIEESGRATERTGTVVRLELCVWARMKSETLFCFWKKEEEAARPLAIGNLVIDFSLSWALTFYLDLSLRKRKKKTDLPDGEILCPLLT
ncbi:hypothetical protein GcM1_227075 [Golovinomyces cichoracearum]|uniref:Uncharacterized protein n=1 Tax=Golovinomyces cichoracearum TaxID=62708 RepID=A0A420IPJ9_9PEZI|nr:hypothetical protein GcM1_227075 [Golovinomyces cichoracearum]